MKAKRVIMITLLFAITMLSGCYLNGYEEHVEPTEDMVVSTPAIDREEPDKESQETDNQDLLSQESNIEQGNKEDGNQKSEIAEDSYFEVHYIDVGQGDCSLILCDGQAMLVDGGESSESSKVYAYLKEKDIKHLNYIVATHAHSDHVGGLSGALNYATVGNVLCPVTDYDSKAFESFKKYVYAGAAEITVPSPGDTFMLGSAAVQILGPQSQYDNENDQSIVLKVIYGDTSFLFTGDVERTAEEDILSVGYDLSATVLKVGHHGSADGTSYPFLREIMPLYAIIQVGEGNSYGHPTEAVLSRLRDAEVTVYRNDLHGTIVCASDSKTVSFVTEKDASEQRDPTVSVLPEIDDMREYIGNKNSHKFHLPSCRNLPAEKNRVYINSRQEAIDNGYSPCGNCNP